MDQFSTEFIFGEALSGINLGGLNLSKITPIDKLLAEDKEEKNDQDEEDNSITQIQNQKQKKRHPFAYNQMKADDSSLPINEKDLCLEIMCIQEGEKIYRLSDLFIPVDQRKIKKIESFMNKIMNASEKEKNEKEEEAKKKDAQDKKEISNLIIKSRKNQKYTKVNVTHNEKFFDKTMFLDNMKSTHDTNIEDNNNSHNEAQLKHLDDMNKEQSNFQMNKEHESNQLVNIKNYEENITNELLKFKAVFNKVNKENVGNISNMNTDGDILKIKDTNMGTNDAKVNNFESNTIDLFAQSVKKTINQALEQNNNNIIGDNIMSSPQHNSNKNDTNVIQDMMIDNENITPITPKPLMSMQMPNTTNDNTFNINNLSQFKSEKQQDINNNNHHSFSPESKRERNNNELINNIYNSSLFLSNDYFKSFSFNKSDLIADISPESKQETKGDYDHIEFEEDKNTIDNYDLYDFIKRKRHRAEGYFNPFITYAVFSKCYLITNKEVNPYYSEVSKVLYDMNDYNMNFEVLIPSNETGDKKKDRDPKDNIKQDKQLIGEDFFNTLPMGNKGNALNHQSVLKIGKSKGNLLTHAKCSYNFTYNKINLNYEDLREFHRPNFCKHLIHEKKKRNFSFKIGEDYEMSTEDSYKRWPCVILSRSYLRKKEKKRISKNVQYMNAYEIFKDRNKLSLVDGKFCLFEHINEYPLFISNFGMASKMKKFIYNNKLFNMNVSNPNTKLTDVEFKTYNIIGPHGTQILLQPNQKLPLLGQIDQNELKGINVIDNKMYRSPVFYEKLKTEETDGKKRYNFLITLKKSKNGKEVIYLRELEHHYIVAQEEPKIEVYPPQSRQYNTFLKNKIETYTYKLYNEIGYKAGINFKVFTNLFPAVTEQVLKKNFKEMNIEIDKNICYFTKIPSEVNQSRITPENICQFESCQFGIYKLREVGIKNLTNADKISYATNKFNNQTQDSKQQFLAKVIEEELLTTPWNITQNFLQSKQIKGMLAIKGIGDPSNGNGGFSFLKMPVKSYNENKTLKEEMDILKNQNKNIKTVTGTDADLRKLSKEDIRLKLIQLGEDEENIKKLSRWERVYLLRYKSSKAVELGYEGEITKYARNQRFNTKTQREEYQKNINDVFKKQISYITSSIDPENEKDDSSDESSEHLYEDYNEDEFKSNYYDEDFEVNKKKSMAFMRNEIYPSKKKKPTEAKRVLKKNDEKIIKVYNKNRVAPVEEENIKIKLDIKNVDIEFLRNKTKGSKLDSIYEYELNKSTCLNRKRRDTPEKLFNEIIEDIIDYCIRNDTTKLFIQPVKKKDYPDYFDFVKKPIDLGTMKNKTKRCEYLNIQTVQDDFELMVANSLTYNKECDVTNQAIKLRDMAFDKIREMKDSIGEMEAKIISQNQIN